jgi:predicted ATPase/class 3 adenylate cyclase
MGELPFGTVTFLFTDMEGSTRLWEENEALMRKALARHDELLGETIADHGGAVFSTMGDGLAAAFQSASAAVICAVDAQSLLGRQSWGTRRPLRVRMGLHTGEAELRGGDYFGTVVNRAARLVSVGHGGQIICSSVTAELVRSDIGLLDLGEHRLRDLDRPMHVFQIGEDSYPPLRSLGAFPGNLPLQLTSFVGRHEELALVAKGFGVSRLVTLTGTGGVGKTRLAVQAAANLVTNFPDGVWLCELAGAVDTESMFQVVAAALEFLPRPGTELQVGIAGFLGSRRMLILFDNCEHLLDPIAALTETILARCVNLVVLATSREALGVDGERVIRVRSLPVPQAGASLNDLSGIDSAQLFLDRAEASGAELTLGPENGRAIAEICRRLDGIPLAIELAAARVLALAPAEIAAHLDERFRLLTSGRRASGQRHQTLRATIDWSYDSLSQRDKTVFNRLGIFPAGFDAPAAQAVAAAHEVEPWDVLDALTSLVGKSMLNADHSTPGPTRYQMLESLRDYARERLDTGGDSDETRRCHARHYASAVAEMNSGMRGPDEILWRRRVDAELENFRSAVTWALDSASEDDGELALVILGESLAGLIGEGAHTVFAGVVDRAEERARPGASRYRSLVLTGVGVEAYYRGDFSRGRELSEEAVQTARVSPHPGVVLALRLNYVDRLSLEAEVANALQILDEVRADRWDYGWVHALAAVMAVIFGKLTLARREAIAAVEFGRRIDNPSLLGIALYGSALTSWQSDPAAARTALEEHISIARGTDYMLARSLALLAQLRVSSGDLADGLEALREGLESAHLNSDRPATAVCLARGAVVMAALGEHETAAVFLGSLTSGVVARSGGVSPNEIPDQHDFVAALRSELGEARYTAATARGAAMSYDQASAFALAATEGRRQN